MKSLFTHRDKLEELAQQICALSERNSNLHVENALLRGEVAKQAERALRVAQEIANWQALVSGRPAIFDGVGPTLPVKVEGGAQPEVVRPKTARAAVERDKRAFLETLAQHMGQPIADEAPVISTTSEEAA